MKEKMTFVELNERLREELERYKAEVVRAVVEDLKRLVNTFEKWND